MYICVHVTHVHTHTLTLHTHTVTTHLFSTITTRTKMTTTMIRLSIAATAPTPRPVVSCPSDAVDRVGVLDTMEEVTTTAE